MKGQTMELINILLLVVSVSILLVISYFFSLRTSSIERGKVSLQQYKRLEAVVNEIFYSDVPLIEKTPAQLIGDAIHNRSDSLYYKELVYYGKARKSVNVTDIISDLMDSHFNNWKIEIYDKNRKLVEFEHYTIEEKNVITYNLPIPIPSYLGETVNVRIKVW